MKIRDYIKPKEPVVRPGVYIAVCVGVVSLGEQYSEFYKKYQEKVRFVWAIPDETYEESGEIKEKQISKDFTISYDRRGNLRPFLETWNCCTYSDDEFIGLEFNDQIGKPCQLQVSLDKTGEYANITLVMPLPKGMTAPKSITRPFKFDIRHWNESEFESLPDWAKEKIKKSTEYKKMHITQQDVTMPATTDEKGSVPF